MKAILLITLTFFSPVVFCQGGGLSRPSRETFEDFEDNFTSHFKYEIQNVDRKGRYLSTEATGQTTLDAKLSYSSAEDLYHQSMQLRHHPTLNYRGLYGNRHLGTINSNGLNLLIQGSEEHYSISYHPGHFFDANVYGQLTSLDGHSHFSSAHTVRELPVWLWLGSPEMSDFRTRLSTADYLADPYANTMFRAQFDFQENCPLPSTLFFPRGVSYQCRTASLYRNWLLKRFKQHYWQAITTIQLHRGQYVTVIQAIIGRFDDVRIIWTSTVNPVIVNTSVATHNSAAAMLPYDSGSSCSVLSVTSIPCTPVPSVHALPLSLQPVSLLLTNAIRPEISGLSGSGHLQLIRNNLAAP